MSKSFYFEKKAKRELDKIISELLINDRDVTREELSGFCPERLEIAKIDNPETKNQRKFNALIDDILMEIDYEPTFKMNFYAKFNN